MKKRELFFVIIVLIIVMAFFSRFVLFVEDRPGIVLNDYFLASFTASDLTWPIFIAIYGGMILGLGILIAHPDNLLLLLESYILMILFRVVCMYLLPLEPPIGMILLKDPLVEYFGTSKTLTKDLFFSGHTASMTLFTLVTPKKWKWIFLLLTLFIAAAVLMQKVHYTIDVMAAPLISILAYNLAFKFRKKLIHQESN